MLIGGKPIARFGLYLMAWLVAGLITEYGVCKTSEDGLPGLHPERR